MASVLICLHPHLSPQSTLSSSGLQTNQTSFPTASLPSVTLHATLALEQRRKMLTASLIINSKRWAKARSSLSSYCPCRHQDTECTQKEEGASPHHTHQVPEAVMLAWVLTAQNICWQTVHLAHVQSDPVKKMKEERASWKDRLMSHTDPSFMCSKFCFAQSTDTEVKAENLTAAGFISCSWGGKVKKLTNQYSLSARQDHLSLDPGRDITCLRLYRSPTSGFCCCGNKVVF